MLSNLEFESSCTGELYSPQLTFAALSHAAARRVPNAMTIAELPDPSELEHALRAAAILDTILCAEDWLRYTRFHPDWSPDTRMAMVDNGAGDTLVALFAPQGAIIKGFDHESALSPYAGDTYEVWPGIYEQTPPKLLALLDDEALERDDATFCLWREPGDGQWNKGDVTIPPGESDGSGFLLGAIHLSAEAYADWASSYYECQVDLEAVRYVYEGGELTGEWIARLNP